MTEQTTGNRDMASGGSTPSGSERRYFVRLCPECGAQQDGSATETHFSGPGGECPNRGKLWGVQALEVIPAPSIGEGREPSLTREDAGALQHAINIANPFWRSKYGHLNLQEKLAAIDFSSTPSLTPKEAALAADALRFASTYRFEPDLEAEALAERLSPTPVSEER